MTDPEAPPDDPRLARALGRVRRVSRAGLCTWPAYTAAARLLVDMERAAEAHGATPDDFSAVTDLPGACLDVTTSHLRGVNRVHQAAAEQGYPSSEALAVHLIAVVHAELVDVHDIPHTYRAGSWSLTFTTPRGNSRSVRAGADGWSYDCNGPGLVDSIAAPYTDEGARAVAAVLADIVAGNRPDPLLRGY